MMDDGGGFWGVVFPNDLTLSQTQSNRVKVVVKRRWGVKIEDEDEDENENEEDWKPGCMGTTMKAWRK
jgi:hypothetical protein